MTRRAPGERQKRFVAEYAADFNATQAARRAGYAESHSTSSRLLERYGDDAAIVAARKKREEKTVAAFGALLQILLAEAQGRSPGSTSKSRVRAWYRLGRLLGMFRPGSRAPAAAPEVVWLNPDGSRREQSEERAGGG